MTIERGTANERERESDGMGMSRQTTAMPAAANRQTQAHPTPGGRGNKPKQADRRES